MHTWRFALCFFFLGTLNDFSYAAMLLAAQAILKSSNLPTATVFLTNIIPTVLVRLIWCFLCVPIVVVCLGLGLGLGFECVDLC